MTFDELLQKIERGKELCVKSGNYRDFYDYSIKNGLISISDNGHLIRDAEQTIRHISKALKDNGE